MKNRYEIDGDIVKIFLNTKQGDYFTIIDKDDFELVNSTKNTWCLKHKNSVYAQRNVYLGKIDGKDKYRTVKMHDEIMDCPSGMMVDHINHDTLDNRRSNLRIVDIKSNDRHRSGANKNNKSGYRNVCFIQNKWQVQLMVNGKNTCLGRFEDLHEAGAFAEKMRHKYYGDFAGKG